MNKGYTSPFCWFPLLYLQTYSDLHLTKRPSISFLSSYGFISVVSITSISLKPSLLYLLLPLHHSHPNVLQFGFYFSQLAEMIVSKASKYVQIIKYHGPFAILIPAGHLHSCSYPRSIWSLLTIILLKTPSYLPLFFSFCSCLPNHSFYFLHTLLPTPIPRTQNVSQGTALDLLFSPSRSSSSATVSTVSLWR